jgi:hypothetical protein
LETPSPNDSVGKKRGSKPSGKLRQKAATNLPQFVAPSYRFLPPFVAGISAAAGRLSEVWKNGRHLTALHLHCHHKPI